MTDNKRNHPGRAKPDLPGTPTGAEIWRAREAAGMTVEQAAAVVLHEPRQWEQWEGGDRRMHPVIWSAFLQRAGAPLPRVEHPVEPKVYNTAKFAGWHCKACGWPVVHACCNDEMSVLHPTSDWWGYCSNQGCVNHAGSDWGQGSSVDEWMVHRDDNKSTNPTKAS